MSLYVAYNCATCSELLEASIKQIAPIADRILIHYQTTTNTGLAINTRHTQKYYELIEKYDIALVQFSPNLNLTPKQNETNKRNMALEFAKATRHSTFMTIDEDEFYQTEQLDQAYKIFIDGNWDSSVCRLYSYYKLPTLQVHPPEDYYCSIFYKVNSRNFVNGLQFPVKVDPARKMKPGRLKIFSWEELAMHHMSYVRKDIEEKLRSQSASVNWPDKIEELVKYHQAFTNGKALWGGKELRNFQLKRVDNLFNIEI